jgi:hypothetical protein
MTKVPFVDFASPYQELKAELDAAYFRFMESTWYVLGKEAGPSTCLKVIAGNAQTRWNRCYKKYS